MKRVPIAVVLGCAILLGAGGALGPAEAAPVRPSFSASMSFTRACELKVLSGWAKSEPVAEVFVIITMPTGGTITMYASPGYVGANAGTFKGQKATFQTGAFASATSPQDWAVRVDFYAGPGGAQLQQIFLAAQAPCTVAIS